MDFDNSLKALLKPGEATKFFDLENLKDFQINTQGYSKINAWWLSELSRLVYKREISETKKAKKGFTRNRILKKVNLTEDEFFNKGGTQCSIVKPLNTQDKKFAVVVFRGTDDTQAAFVDAKLGLVPWEQGGQVHQGFKDALNKIWEKLNAKLDTLDCPVFYTGHSLGAALAILAASRRPPQAVYNFGCPRVGDKDFSKTVKNIKIYRVVNNRDFVTRVPPAIEDSYYVHVGKLFYISHNNRMLISPDDKIVASDRQKRDETLKLTTNKKTLLSFLPEDMSDHTPVNYVAHLERYLL